MEHYKKLLGCAFFSAPKTPINPYRIPADTELIEIITDGVVFYPDPDGTEYRRGTVFWHQAGEWTIHHTSPAEPYRCFVCKIATDGSPRQTARVGRWGRVPDLSTFVDDMLNFSVQRKLEEEEVFYYCIGTLLRQQLQDSSLPRQLQRVCSKLNNDPSANESVESLAEYAGVSASRLFALFQHYLHSSPHKYQLQCRINMAKELLSERMEIPIKQISEMCGFSSLEVFYRRFHQHSGITPGEYRKKFICR